MKINLKYEHFYFPDGYSVLFIRSKSIIRHLWLIPKKVNWATICLRELWEICLLKTSYPHDTNIFLYLRKWGIFKPGLWSMLHGYNPHLQTCFYTCFDACVVLLYSSSFSCGRRSISLVPIAVNAGNPGLLTACEQARKLSAKPYDVHHCCVYCEKLLMMDRWTVRNM